MSESFAQVMEDLRARAGISRHRLAVETPCDPSYLVRIAHGDREPPRLHVIHGIARALRCSRTDHDRLLVSAGYLPHQINAIGWHRALQAVADVLSDPFLEDSERDQFAAVVQSIAERWRGGSAAPAPRATNGAATHAPEAAGTGR